MAGDDFAAGYGDMKGPLKTWLLIQMKKEKPIQPLKWFFKHQNKIDHGLIVSILSLN